MMKWGRKKKNTSTSSSSSHSSSSAQSLISHAFPMSWFSRFKNVKRSSESEEVNVKGKRSSVSPKSGVSSDSWNGGRFYGRDDDSYWSLSFRKDRLKGEKGRSCSLKPERYNSDDELYSPLQEVTQRRKAKESGSLQRKNGCKVNMDSGKVEVRTRRRRVLKHQKSGEESGRIWEEGKECQRKSDKGKVSYARSVENDVFEVKPGRINSQKHSGRQHRSNSIDLGTIEEDCIFEGLISEQSNTFSDDELSVKWRNQKNKKIDDIMLRNENQKTSLHLRKERQRRRRRMKQSQNVKAYSPRSPAKIKALEDMKRARMKTKKMIKEKAVKDMTNFNSFAVVKCSVDPEEDFRESMVEMIREKGIREPEVLEELLECYLTLNCDEHHELIVKVFREVWIDLNQEQFHQELELINCCYL